MNIAVCLCQVPDTASVIGFVDGAVDRSRVNEVMNPYDEYALEEAVRLKECFQQSIVTVFCVAPDSAREMLRKALALGADRAVRVSCPTELSDPFQTARVLSQAISAYYSAVLPDLVFLRKVLYRFSMWTCSSNACADAWYGIGQWNYRSDGFWRGIPG